MEYYAWCDSSWNENNSSTGYIIKNSQGTTISKERVFLENCKTCTEAELTGVITLIEVIISLQLHNVTIYNDCASVISGANKNIEERNTKFEKEMSKQFSYIDKMLKKIDTIQLQWIPRRENKEADSLSRGSTPILPMFKSVSELPDIMCNQEWNQYIISNSIREMYRDLCPKSFRKCKSIQELDYKITRSIEIGRIAIHNEGHFTVTYANLCITVENDIIVNLCPTENKRYFPTTKNKKKLWEEKNPFLNQVTKSA